MGMTTYVELASACSWRWFQIQSRWKTKTTESYRLICQPSESHRMAKALRHRRTSLVCVCCYAVQAALVSRDGRVGAKVHCQCMSRMRVPAELTTSFNFALRPVAKPCRMT